MSEESKERDKERYLAAAHAMQTGVAWKMRFDQGETQPKHLRVGVNAALVDVGAVATLLIGKGVFTEEEYFAALADAMERECDLYQREISENLGGTNVTLS